MMATQVLLQRARERNFTKVLAVAKEDVGTLKSDLSSLQESVCSLRQHDVGTLQYSRYGEPWLPYRASELVPEMHLFGWYP